MVFLMETKTQTWQLECIRLKIQMVGCMGVDQVGLGGGLALLWKKEGVIISLLFQLIWHTDVNVTFSNGD